MIGHFPRFNSVIALLTQRGAHDDLAALARKEYGKVSDLAELRARRIHDAWYVDMASGEPIQFRSMPRKELNFGFQPQTISELNELIRRIRQRIDAITKLGEIILAELFPSPGKSS
jgi:hypothetical protein